MIVKNRPVNIFITNNKYLLIFKNTKKVDNAPRKEAINKRLKEELRFKVILTVINNIKSYKKFKINNKSI